MTDTKTIMLIEDDKRMIRLLTDLLEIKGYHIVSTTDGLDSVKLAKATKPDLFLVDKNLFLLDGLRLIDIFKNDDELKDIPVIACTGESYNVVITKLKSINCNGYVGKPIDPVRLHNVIERVLNGETLI